MALLLLVAAGVLAQSWALPAMEGGDEVVHLNYVLRLLGGAGLPDRAIAATNATQQASGQPPLAYFAYAFFGRLTGMASLDGNAVLDHVLSQKNPWHFPHYPWASRDNHSIYVHGLNDRTGFEEPAFGWPELVTQTHALRLAGLMWALLGVEGAWWAAREVFRRSSWAWTAALLFGLMPTSLFLAATVTNDGLAAALCAWATWAMLRTLRRGATLRLSLIMGLFIGLAALTKVSALLLGPAALLAILLASNAPRWRTQSGRWLRWLIVRGVLLALPVAMLFGPWVVWGWVNSGDPFGLGTHQYQTPGLYFADGQPLGELLARLPQTFWTYFVQYNTVQPALAIMLALLLVPLWSVLGGLLALRRSMGSAFAVRSALVLGLVVFLTALALLRWMGQFAITGGRLMYPAHAAIAIALTAGLYALWRRWPAIGRAAQAYAVVVVAVSGIVLGPLAIRGAHAAPPRLSESELPALSGGPVEFRESNADAPFLRLLGAAFPEGERITGDALPLMLCWQALGQPASEPAFSAKLILDGEIGADRTSLFGLGRYPSALWQPGDIWCDTFDLWMDDPDLATEPPLRPGTRYDLVVAVLDAETQASDYERTRDGQPIDAVVIGQAVSPAEQMNAAPDLTPAAIQFPGLATLSGYRLDETTQELTLRWSVEGEVSDPLSTFVHLYRFDEFVGVLADGVPRGGRYPTTDWRSGERFTDSWTLELPDELPPGAYAIRVGMYNPETGARRPILQDGAQASDAGATVVTFSVE